MQIDISQKRMSEMRVVIDNADDVLYKSFYVYGLVELFGHNSVGFSSRPFVELTERARNTKSMRFLLQSSRTLRRYVIDCNDSYEIDEELYNWCDIYGSVNANFSKTPEKYHKKLISLCPSFGIRCWNTPQTIFHALCNWPASESSMRKFFGKHKRLLSRPTYLDYLAVDDEHGEEDNYVFFLSTLWYSDEWNKNDEGVNARRANFIHACKGLDSIFFEGGLVSQGKERSSEILFADCLSKGVSMKDWMEKTKRSVLVFNTPAFWDCHGWKLGEYLAMGKCILSTPLSNDLPTSLEHGKHVHFVDNDIEAMQDAVSFIVGHPDYRRRLEVGAKSYWEHFGSPIASLKLLGIEA